MKLVVATHNAHKCEEFARILNPLNIEVVSQDEIGVTTSADETETTFIENAYIKAKAVYDVKKCMVVADDSGLEVDALDKAPGVYTARYGGEGLNDKQRYEYLLKNMENVPKDKRQARFCCALVLIMPNGDEYQFFETCEGEIGYEAQGKDGFGYDPVFIVNGKSFAQISGEEKDKMSHRGKALRKLADKLAELV